MIYVVILASVAISCIGVSSGIEWSLLIGRMIRDLGLLLCMDM